MAALIAIYTSQGCIGRCDARCYQATRPDCTCICGGRNHGKGFEQSIINTRTMASGWIAAVAEAHNLHDLSTAIHQECQQETVWSHLDE